jgi:hypothetical protein
MIFGASPSVANIDILGTTIAELVVVDSGILRYLESRALDDIPVLASHGTVWTSRIGNTFMGICEDCGEKGADNC